MARLAPLGMPVLQSTDFEDKALGDRVLEDRALAPLGIAEAAVAEQEQEKGRDQELEQEWEQEQEQESEQGQKRQSLGKAQEREVPQKVLALAQALVLAQVSNRRDSSPHAHSKLALPPCQL